MLHNYIFQRDNFLMNRNYTIVKRDWRFRKKKDFENAHSKLALHIQLTTKE